MEIEVVVGVVVFNWDGKDDSWTRGLDDSGVVIGVNLRQSAQKQAVDVGQDGGATGRDAVLGEDFVEVLQGMVDALSGLEAFEVSDELEVVIGGLLS